MTGPPDVAALQHRIFLDSGTAGTVVNLAQSSSSACWQQRMPHEHVYHPFPSPVRRYVQKRNRKLDRSPYQVTLASRRRSIRLKRVNVDSDPSIVLLLRDAEKNTLQLVKGSRNPHRDERGGGEPPRPIDSARNHTVDLRRSDVVLRHAGPVVGRAKVLAKLCIHCAQKILIVLVE